MSAPGCGGKEQREITVHSASSLTDAMQVIAREYEKKSGIKVNLNLASSGFLQKQIEGGAPGDVFVSAGKAQMDALQEKGLLDTATRFDLLGNRLVIVVRESSGLTINNAADIAGRDVHIIAIGDPAHVPAGRYAKEALEKARVWKDVKDRLTPTLSVRAALAAVESGDADIVIVFKTDAAASDKTRVALMLPPESHSPIVYPAAVLNQSEHPELAARFVDFLKTGTAAKIFQKYGFEVIENEQGSSENDQ